MKKINIFLSLFLLLSAFFFSSCTDDTYTSRGDLFQPRFAQDPVVEGNNIKLVWYKVNDAVSYTIQLFNDNYYTDKFMELDVINPYIDIEDIPYASNFYIRVRSNASDSSHDSQWNTTSATTESRPVYAELLQDVSKTEITEEQATIRWTVDADNPVDSISVAPKVDKTLPTITRYLTADEIADGKAVVTGLNKNTLYSVNIYDTSKPRKYDKPYNEITFRTAGPAAQSIQIGLLDDLNAILKANNDDAEIPEGTEYYLQAGSHYVITPFEIKKGFRIVGAIGEKKAVVEMNGSWSFQSSAYIQSLEFQNVEIRNTAINQYFMNCGSPFTIENVSLINVDFKNIMRGFWRQQGTSKKWIQNFEMEGCSFDQCGWQTGCYGTFAFGSAGKNNVASYDQVDRMIMRNCTFMRGGYDMNTAYGWGNIIDYSTSNCPIDLQIKNVTIYNFCVNNRLINITNATGSSLTVSGMLLASPSGDFYMAGSNTTTTFSNNYTTIDYALGGAKIKATDLSVKATDVFVDPANGDLTIKDTSSPIYINRAGDTRWIK